MVTIGVVPTVIFWSKRAMTQNQPNNPPSEERLERAKKSEFLFQARSLVNASPDEVGKAALGYTKAKERNFE